MRSWQHSCGIHLYVIWLVNIASGIMVPLSNAIFGKDTTADWTLFGLKSTQTLGILGVVFIIAVTFLQANGLKKYPESSIYR